MISIRIRGYADAQAISDAMTGRGVTWREPYGRESHSLTVQHLTLREAREILDDLRIENAKLKES